MKQHFTLLMLCLVSALMSTAQVVSKDSISSLKNEKQRLKIAKEINEHQLKLAALENEVTQRTVDLQQKREAADKAVAENQDAANQLSSDNQDKGKAKAASKAGRNAEKKAKEARKAQEKLQDLNGDIEKLRAKIREDEQKIATYGGTSTVGQ